jgi:hypothetical protein
MRTISQKYAAVLLVALCLLGSRFSMAHGGSHQEGWVDVGGNVSFGEIPVCALVLINGVTQFSCDGTGRYDMEVPIDSNGMITVMVFADGFSPFNQIVTPEQAEVFPIDILLDQNSPSFQVDTTYEPSVTEGRFVVSGNIYFGTIPVCALVLANGTTMFSCNENQGQFSLDVPVDQDGNITLMVFAAGFKPFKQVISTLSPPRANTTEGLWTGSTGNNRGMTGLVLDDGTYYFLYTAEGNRSVIAGVVQGNSLATGNDLTSSNAKDFNLEGEGILSATVSATVSSNRSLIGEVHYLDGFNNSFTASYNSAYDHIPSLEELSGTFSGPVAFSLGQESADITIAQNGTISGLGASGCRVGGLVYPRSSGNVFNLSLDFGGSPCYFAYQNFIGIVYFDSANQRIYAIAPNANRTDGVLYLGYKR